MGFVIGSCFACFERFLEPARQRVAARLLGVHRLLEDRLPPRRFLGENALRIVQLGLVPAFGLVCETTRPRFGSMTSVDWQHGQVTSSSDFSRVMSVPPRCQAALRRRDGRPGNNAVPLDHSWRFRRASSRTIIPSVNDDGSTTLRVVTYNIHRSVGLDRRRRPERIAAVLARSTPTSSRCRK